MAKPPYYRIFLDEVNVSHLIFRLFQQKSDQSLMLSFEPTGSDKLGKRGRMKIQGNIAEITYSTFTDNESAFEHTTIHASGQSHTKLTDGTKTIHNDKSSPSIPLSDLKTVKHLATLVIADQFKKTPEKPTRSTDVPINRPAPQNTSIVDILAIPKTAKNLQLNVDWEMENDRPVQITIDVKRLFFNGFDVILFTRHTDQFDKSVPFTIQIPDMNNFVPFVTHIDDEHLLIKISELTFGQMLLPASEPPEEQPSSSISATSKYL